MSITPLVKTLNLLFAIWFGRKLLVCQANLDLVEPQGHKGQDHSTVAKFSCYCSVIAPCKVKAIQPIFSHTHPPKVVALAQFSQCHFG